MFSIRRHGGRYKTERNEANITPTAQKATRNPNTLWGAARSHLHTPGPWTSRLALAPLFRSSAPDWLTEGRRRREAALASGTPEAAVRLPSSSSSSSVLVRLPPYKTVVYTIYLSTIKSAKEKRRGPKKKHKRIHSFLLSTKTSCRTKTKRGNNLILKGSTKIHSIRQTRIDYHIHKWFTNHLLLVP